LIENVSFCIHDLKFDVTKKYYKHAFI